jgi:hypothetical protein
LGIDPSLLKSTIDPIFLVNYVDGIGIEWFYATFNSSLSSKVVPLLNVMR